MDQLIAEQLRHEIQQAQKVLIGIGEEWETAKNKDMLPVYNKLYQLVRQKDFFVVTLCTDGLIYDSSFGGKEGVFPPAERITAPCGNVNWRQCSKSCTKDIWERAEVPDDICPHCNAPLTGNTIEAEQYIEEGYLPQWNRYTEWLAGTLNKQLTILELGVGFSTPTVIRWPFEKTAYFHKKSLLYRVNEKLFQISEELKGRAVMVPENSVSWIRNL